MFEWDEAKREANLVKHGLDFVDALEVFGNPLRIERIDKRREHREERRHVVGRVGEEMGFVVDTLRREARRVISARRASKDERREYLTGRARR